jgi:hypothetical protein
MLTNNYPLKLCRHSSGELVLVVSKCVSITTTKPLKNETVWCFHEVDETSGDVNRDPMYDTDWESEDVPYDKIQQRIIF